MTTPRRRALPPDIHAVPVGDPTGHDHAASRTCWCGPAASYRDLATGAPVWRSRAAPFASPPPATPPSSTEAMA